MLNVGRIRRAYREAGSLNSLLSLWGFVDDHTFLTKAGHVGLVYRIAGMDHEGLDHSQRRDLVHRYEAASRLLDDSYRVYQNLCKRRIQPVTAPVCRQPVVNDTVQSRAAYLNARGAELYDVEVYLVLVYLYWQSYEDRDRHGHTTSLSEVLARIRQDHQRAVLQAACEEVERGMPVERVLERYLGAGMTQVA